MDLVDKLQLCFTVEKCHIRDSVYWPRANYVARNTQHGLLQVNTNEISLDLQ